MAKQYQWQISLDAAGPIEAGILEGDPTVHTVDIGSGTTTAKFYYLDSNAVSSSDWLSNSSRVVITVNTSWITSVDNSNNLIVAAGTTITKIERDNIVGNPNLNTSDPRNMDAYYYQGGTSLWHYTDSNIAVAKTIATNVDLGTYTFILAPGSGDSQHTMFFFNKNPNIQSLGDRLNLGIKFTNILPPDYRPGAILDGNGVWQSHNRAAGTAHILTSGGTWSEMRTSGAPTDMGDTPSIRKNNAWYNMAKLGKE
mgnify:CR=1 FL=1